MYFTDAMANGYDMALRERVVAAYERGEGSYAAMATLFLVDRRTVQRWVARKRATGSVAPRPPGGGWRCPIDLAVLDAVIGARPDGTVAELCRAYNRHVPRRRRTTETSFRRAMRREGYVLKKNGRARVRSTARTSAGSGWPL
jgi:transposase